MTKTEGGYSVVTVTEVPASAAGTEATEDKDIEDFFTKKCPNVRGSNTG
jgi:hypothetical protein